MFNIYRAVKESRQRQEAQLTGHDLYSSGAVRARTIREQRLEERRLSAKDTNRTTVRDLFRSPEPRASTPRKLARCSRRASAAPAVGQELQPSPVATAAVTAGCIRRRSGTPTDRWVCDAGVARPSTAPLSERQRSEVASQAATSLCQQYLATSDRYRLLQPLNDLGCRSNKHWFLVYDELVKTERLLTITSVTHRPQLLQLGSRTKILRERLMRAKHPYLFPVLDADLMDLPQGYPAVVVITPCSYSGSLRDIQHKCSWDRDWSEKYSRPVEERLRLPVPQARRLALQLVEALLHLRQSGVITSFGRHLHAGNVMVQNGVARLADLEASLLEYEPSDWESAPPSSDVRCIGALIYQMVSGRQPGRCGPTAADLSLLDDDTRSQLAPVMAFIFGSVDGLEPSLDMLACLEFFRTVQLRELARRPSSITDIKMMVPMTREAVRNCRSDHELTKAQSPQRRRKRSSSMPDPNNAELQEFRRMHQQFSQLTPH